MSDSELRSCIKRADYCVRTSNRVIQAIILDMDQKQYRSKAGLSPEAIVDALARVVTHLDEAEKMHAKALGPAVGEGSAMMSLKGPA
jgi:hypothetical protein